MNSFDPSECARFEERIVDACAAPAPDAELDRHLAACAACRATKDALLCAMDAVVAATTEEARDRYFNAAHCVCSAASAGTEQTFAVQLSLTGATISSRAVVKILNGGNAVWRPRLPAPGAAPAAATEPDRGALPPDVDRGGPIPGGRAGEGR